MKAHVFTHRVSGIKGKNVGSIVKSLLHVKSLSLYLCTVIPILLF